MATEKELKSRLLQKHDTEANWNKAVNFVPKAGEIIVYDDVYPKIKIGDGVKTVANLNYASNMEVIDIDRIPEDYSTYENILSMFNKGLTVYLKLVRDLVPFSGVDHTTGNLKFIGPVTNVDNLNWNITISQDNNIKVSYSCSGPITITGEMTSDTEGVITSSDITLELIVALYQQDVPPIVFLSIPGLGINLPAIGSFESSLFAAFEECEESSISQMLVMFDLASKTVNIINHEVDIITPDELTKEAVGLGNVENKSSATIRGELTKANVVAALGYTPPEQDTNTTYENATSSAAGLMSAADKTKLNNTNIAYATCSTAAATVAKVATITGNSNWALTTGAIIGIKFTESNSASNPTINVNGTGAKSVVYGTAAITTSNLTYAGYADRTILYMYNGTNYVFLGWSYDANSDTKVTQANTTSNTAYNVLLSYGAASTSSVTNTVKKSANLQFNPSTKTLTVANLAGNATSADGIGWGSW